MYEVRCDIGTVATPEWITLQSGMEEIQAWRMAEFMRHGAPDYGCVRIVKMEPKGEVSWPRDRLRR